MKKQYFTKGVEGLINPITVGSLHFLQSLSQLLPKSVQKLIVKSSSKKMPYMGFVVEPYSSFIFYEIEDIERAKTLLPDGFELMKSRAFVSDVPKYYCIFGCINAHTSAFWGIRAELYIIAKDIKTGLLSWIIVDYDTNTISFDNKRGLSSPNATKSIITTDYNGNLYVDIINNDSNRRLAYDFNIEKGQMKKLDQRLWLEGNLSIGYGSNFDKKDAAIFSLRFDPLEVEKALEIPINSFHLDVNSWYRGLFKEKPSQIVCFPYAQHFISDSPGNSSKLTNKNDLVAAIESIDFSGQKVYSADSFKSMFIIGSILSTVITVTLIILLIFK